MQFQMSSCPDAERERRGEQFQMTSQRKGEGDGEGDGEKCSCLEVISKVGRIEMAGFNIAAGPQQLLTGPSTLLSAIIRPPCARSSSLSLLPTFSSLLSLSTFRAHVPYLSLSLNESKHMNK